MMELNMKALVFLFVREDSKFSKSYKITTYFDINKGITHVTFFKDLPDAGSLSSEKNTYSKVCPIHTLIP